jgi:phosphonate transport system substrate-binding protein
LIGVDLVMRQIIFLLFLLTASLVQLNAQGKKLVLATYTYSTNNRPQNLAPLADYLSQQTGYTITAVSYPTVQALISAIVNDSVDFAMMNTSGYLTLQRKNPGAAIPLVNLDMANTTSTNYAGCLIANKQTGITNTKQLFNNKNRFSLALVNASSTSGNLVPRLLLNDNKITQPENFFKVSYLGSHRKVAEDIMNIPDGIGGCGCAEIDSVRKYAPFDSKVTIIDSFNNIPLGPVVYKKNLEKKIARIIATQLLQLHTAAPDIFTRFCAGWTEFRQARSFKKVTDKEYDDFRKLFGNNTQLWQLIE